MTDSEAPLEDLTPIADCRFCRYRQKLLLMGRCTPGDACVRAESGRQIDRFFRINPSQAVHFLSDSFWERRAVAVRYIPESMLADMAQDPDEAVRRAVAYRLPKSQLAIMMYDPDREVRITVADRLAIEELEAYGQ